MPTVTITNTIKRLDDISLAMFPCCMASGPDSSVKKKRKEAIDFCIQGFPEVIVYTSYFHNPLTLGFFWLVCQKRSSFTSKAAHFVYDYLSNNF